MLKYYALFPLIFLSFLNQSIGQTQKQSPNILFFLIDDIRNTSLGCYGHPIIQTPNIDKLANKGTRFTNAFVTTSICAASRASILTGLYESTHGYTFGKPPIIKKQTDDSFPNQLKKAGFQTGFVGKWGMKTEVNRKSMFDFFKPISLYPYFKKINPELEAHPSGICEKHDQDFDPTFIPLPSKLRHVTEVCGDKALQFIQQQEADTPFFLQVSFNAVHAQDSDKENHYMAAKSVDNLYENIAVMPTPRLDDSAIYEAMPDFLKKSLNRLRYFWRWDTPGKYQKNMRAYFKMISGVDKVIGQLVAVLKENGMDKNTIIIIAGDNGYYMGDRGFAGKWSHFEESLRVPLLIYDPAQQGGKVESKMALNIDIPATILDYAKRSIPESYQGKSLRPLIENKPHKKWRTSFFVEHRMNHKAIPKWEGIRDKRFVYANYYEQQPAYEFLYDLEKDPDQLENLAKNSNYRKVLKKMRKKVKRKEQIYF